MFCREVRTSISPYLDGQLDSLQTRQLKEHLATCESCQQQLDLMQAIPVALQTDRVLAPQAEFTKLVMQRIIVREQVVSSQFETQISISRPTNVVAFGDYASKRPKNPSDYVLWFSSVAAAIVVMVGVAIYLNTNQTSEAATASVYGSIKDFADNLSNGLNSPVELVAGIAIAAAILIGLWYTMRALRPESQLPGRDLDRGRN